MSHRRHAIDWRAEIEAIEIAAACVPRRRRGRSTLPPEILAAVERTTFKLHVWPKDAKTWSKKVQEFTSVDDCKAAVWVQKQKGNAATCDTQ